jgi:hypothetical protein
MKPHFHVMSDTEWKFRQLRGDTWGDVQRDYRQPEWCGYPDALGGFMGCWSLVGRMVTGENYCRDCDLYSPFAAGEQGK